ncbi:hypothetical protein HYPSUDRAFT_112233, partial [Hypholoma sublateritium FD-334 SS-4]
MLTFVLEYRPVIQKFTADQENDIRELELSKEEWKIVKQLNEVLMAFKHTTQFFSRATLHLANVILVMDIVSDRLTAQANNTRLSPSIQAALGLAKKTLNHYYSKTDDCEAYQIAMVLHPQYKLSYFRTVHWEQEWINVAEQLVRTHYEAEY